MRLPRILREKEPVGHAVILGNPAKAVEITFPWGTWQIQHEGRTYSVRPDGIFWHRKPWQRRPRHFYVFFWKQSPEPITLRNLQNLPLTAEDLRVISGETATGRGIESLAKVGQGSAAVKLGKLMWLILIAAVAAILIMFGPQIWAGLKGMVG